MADNPDDGLSPEERLRKVSDGLANAADKLNRLVEQLQRTMGGPHGA